ncbi:hypothetical protein P5673_030663 [Acropora cervicornis]|uniref:Uncharacterized protein n=1 Tax=Acropora cervicornis TaxID=6130 RepID=A0AAD9UT45_ACRCE|nr:hypothetical protein P5673_030663 [Acropora cervicornis]
MNVDSETHADSPQSELQMERRCDKILLASLLLAKIELFCLDKSVGMTALQWKVQFCWLGEPAKLSLDEKRSSSENISIWTTFGWTFNMCLTNVDRSIAMCIQRQRAGNHISKKRLHSKESMTMFTIVLLYQHDKFEIQIAKTGKSLGFAGKKSVLTGLKKATTFLKEIES